MISGFPPGMNNLPPMARKSFLFASTSFEAMCQCPMVTPISLNAAGCAAAVPANASNKTTHICVFADASRLVELLKAPEFNPSPVAGAGCKRSVGRTKESHIVAREVHDSPSVPKHVLFDSSYRGDSDYLVETPVIAAGSPIRA